MHSTCESATLENNAAPNTRNISGLLRNAFRQVRKRTDSLFDILEPEGYHARPIALRHPFIFYDGHLDAFIQNTLFDLILGEPSTTEELDLLFRRGIDPASETLAQAQSIASWPTRSRIQDYKAQITKRLETLLQDETWQRHPDPELASARVFYLLLEHEMMHQETLMYMMHQLPDTLKRPPADLAPLDFTAAPSHRMAAIPAGKALLGSPAEQHPFVWDNEQPTQELEVPAFSMDVYNITNQDFLAFVEADGYHRPEFWEPEAWTLRENSQSNADASASPHPAFWRKQGDSWQYRSFFETIPLPLSWPVMVTYHEAKAYARFVGKSLPTEAEWHRALLGENQGWRFPWGNTLPEANRGNFGFDLQPLKNWNPVPVGSYPEGRSVYGIEDLAGNGWEWTETPFAPFPGFEASRCYPQYSTDFFDGQHYVMKGGSCFTDVSLLRTSFRNWFYGHYPHMYATFRCVTR